MLFPFEERAVSIASLPKAFVPTLTADLKKAAFSGHVVAMNDERSVVLTLDAGRPVSGMFYRDLEGPARLTTDTGFLFEKLSEQSAVEVLRADRISVSLARTFSRNRPAWHSRAKDAAKQVRQAAAEMELGVLARIRGPVCELACLEEGRFSFGYIFEEEESRFVRTDRSGWKESALPGDWLELVASGEPLVPEPELANLRNPLTDVMTRYTDLFKIIGKILRDEHGQQGRDAISELLETFQAKYPPLYRGVYMNPEVGTINWERLLENRDRVNVNYRYEKFTLYLDEILAAYVEHLNRQSGPKGLQILKTAMGKVKQPDQPIANDPVTLLLRRINQLMREGN